MQTENVKIIIGLGNPDAKYKNTYHNIGHFFIDFLNEQNINCEAIKSPSYMNLSGKFVKDQLKKQGLKTKNLMVVHDDSDIELSKWKLSFGRGSAGHKGVQNIIGALKTNKFWRLRIGIRPPEEKRRIKAEKLVLSKISAANKKIMGKVFEKAVQQIKPQL